MDTGATKSFIRKSLVPHYVPSNTGFSAVGLCETLACPLDGTTIFQLSSHFLECTCAILSDSAAILATIFSKSYAVRVNVPLQRQAGWYDEGFWGANLQPDSWIETVLIMWFSYRVVISDSALVLCSVGGIADVPLRDASI